MNDGGPLVRLVAARCSECDARIRGSVRYGDFPFLVERDKVRRMVQRPHRLRRTRDKEPCPGQVLVEMEPLTVTGRIVANIEGPELQDIPR